MRTRRLIAFILPFAAVGLVSSQASAQKIRTYGAQAEAQYGNQQGSTSVSTGANTNTQAPTVSTPATAQAQGEPAAQGEGADQAVDTTSYVTVFKPGGASAPLPVDLTPDKMYRGVIPGTRDEVDHLVEAREKSSTRRNRNQVTWVGFQANESSTRVFFQTGRESSYDLGQDGGSITVTFNDTRLAARNFGRFIDTSFFKRNVTRVDVKQVNKTTVVATIQLRQFEQPDVDRNGNYLYLDFSGNKMEDSAAATGESN